MHVIICVSGPFTFETSVKALILVFYYVRWLCIICLIFLQVGDPTTDEFDQEHNYSTVVQAVGDYDVLHYDGLHYNKYTPMM